MPPLLNEIRAAATPAIWSRGVELCRGDAVSLAPGSTLSGDEIELLVQPQQGNVTARVTLWPEDGEWSCDCNSSEDACTHAAAAAIALGQAQSGRRSLARAATQGAHVAYHFMRTPGGLTLERMIVAGSERVPLAVPLAVRMRAAGPTLNTQRADSEIDAIVAHRPQLAQVPLGRGLLRKVLGALVDMSHVFVDDVPVRIGEPKSPVRIVLSRRAHDAILVRLVRNPALEETYANGAARIGDMLCPLLEDATTQRERESFGRGEVVPAERTGELLGSVLPELATRVEIDWGDVRAPRAASDVPCELQVTLRALDASPPAYEAVAAVIYGRPPLARVVGDTLRLLGDTLPRRLPREEAALGRLAESAFGLHLGQPKRVAGVRGVALLEKLRDEQRTLPIQLQLHNDVEKRFAVRGALGTQLDIAAGEPLLFLLEEEHGAGGVSAQGGSASASAVLEAFERGESLVPLLEGGFAPLPQAWLAKHAAQVRLLIEGRAAIALERAQPAQRGLPAWALPALAELEGAQAPEIESAHSFAPAEPPAGITLRPYQREGIAWLRARLGIGAGALLADDMGLGKTLQALMAMRPPALVVAPTSVLFNWAQEAARFVPNLKVASYHGAGRELDRSADIVLTSYGVLRIDVHLLAQVPWQLVVLDEAQNIKNSASQSHAAACALPAAARLALSGTPVENRLEELWSLMAFLNPGLLGERDAFSQQVASRIAAGDDTQRIALSMRIAPFVLRRTKAEVLRDLPPRTDVVLQCELSDEERAAYDAVRATTQKEVLAQLGAEGSVMRALEALLRLRQAACHRGLLPGHFAPSSSKLELLLETLEEGLAEGHRALVFSQWTGLLDLVEPHLNSRDIAFVRLDGATRDRQKVIAEFTADDGPPVMLASLKAGGVGLNLTAADHVFLLDPWWNPTTEQQAADRAHRMGQTRPVLVHRLIAKGTIEENILALKESKQALAQAVFSGETPQVAPLTREELLALVG